MLELEDRVLVAVSGGPDSVALLHFLVRIAPKFSLGLHVFHLNHKLRGAEAEEDARFVADFAASLGLPATIESLDVPALMRAEKLSLEEAARKARYRVIDRLAGELGFTKVALGHHADDQVETFLMRLIRGAGLEGLSAMAPVRGYLIRPFIELFKDEILAYLDENGLKSRLDASNEDTALLRNRIRLELIPNLLSYNPQFKYSLLKTIEAVREDHVYLEKHSSKAFNALAQVKPDEVRFPIEDITREAKALQRRLVRQAICTVKGDLRQIEFKHIEAVLDGIEGGPAGLGIDLPGEVYIFAEYDWLVVKLKPAQGRVVEQLREVELKVPGVAELDLGGTSIEASLQDVQGLKIDKSADAAYLDADTLPGKLKIRSRKPGDSFRPLGMAKEKKLQDFFVDEKIPKRQRDLVPVVLSDDTIVWVAGFRIDERFKVTDSTKRVLVLKLHRKI